MDNAKHEDTFYLCTHTATLADHAVKELVALFEDAKIVVASHLGDMSIYQVTVPLKHREKFLPKARYHEMINDVL